MSVPLYNYQYSSWRRIDTYTDRKKREKEEKEKGKEDRKKKFDLMETLTWTFPQCQVLISNCLKDCLAAFQNYYRGNTSCHLPSQSSFSYCFHFYLWHFHPSKHPILQPRPLLCLLLLHPTTIQLLSPIDSASTTSHSFFISNNNDYDSPVRWTLESLGSLKKIKTNNKKKNKTMVLRLHFRPIQIEDRWVGMGN